ncbi:DUF488 domain-containing protein, partial [bacterium]|nr:DUF488 domain-containing protein [bacterium]
IYSIGHSKHAIDTFIAMLKEQDIEMLVDVRRFPGSRFNPQFNKNKLKESLEQEGIQYISMVELGGRRDPVPESVNRGWEEPAFQGYADYMQTADFEYALKELLIHAAAHRTAYMCAEVDFHSCHRRLLSDALTVRKCEVIHIKPNGLEPHTLTPFAKVEGTRLSYPSPDESQGSLFD